MGGSRSNARSSRSGDGETSKDFLNTEENDSFNGQQQPSTNRKLTNNKDQSDSGSEDNENMEE